MFTYWRSRWVGRGKISSRSYRNFRLIEICKATLSLTVPKCTLFRGWEIIARNSITSTTQLEIEGKLQFHFKFRLTGITCLLWQRLITFIHVDIVITFFCLVFTKDNRWANAIYKLQFTIILNNDYLDPNQLVLRRRGRVNVQIWHF